MKLGLDFSKGDHGVVLMGDLVIAHIPANARIGLREATAIHAAWRDGDHSPLTKSQCRAALAASGEG